MKNMSTDKSNVTESKSESSLVQYYKNNEVSSIFKVPNVAKVCDKTRVLDEETYLTEMGKIIERDFFPDLEKLRAQNEYLEALEKNDMQKVRELHAKYSSGRFPTDGRLFASPATFETPLDHRPNEDIILNTAIKNDDPPNASLASDPHESTESLSDNKKKLGLDNYLSSHTSEDNHSFQEIIVESKIQHRHKHSWLYETEENCGNSCEENKLTVPSIEEQAQGRERPLNLDTWNYRSKNYIMYVPDGVQLTDSERIDLSIKRQEINHTNTRLAKCPFDETQNKETIQGLAISQSRNLEGKIGVDGKELTFGDTPKVNGFSFVKTPSPAPGVNESPLMTWGDIDGTPFRLDGGDTPLRSSSGPSFKIPEPPKREKLALALAEKAGERHRDRKKKALLAAQRQFTSPSPNRTSGSTFDRLNAMSPAAQRLATSHLKRIGSSDHTLIASYSPLRQSSRTPIALSFRGTPKTPLQVSILNKKPEHTTPKLVPVSKLSSPKRPQIYNLTDNLLNLPKRPRASDYFGL